MNKTFFLVVLTASVLAGCTNEKVISGGTDSSKTISFGTLVHKATKAIPVTGTSFPDGGNFMVLGYNTGANTLDEVTTPMLDFMRQTVTKNGTSYTYSPVKYWPNGTPKISFFAVSPADVATITPTVLNSTGLPTVTYNVPADVLQQKDLMMAVATDKSNESVSFPFKHALTKIGFTAKLAADYVAQGAYVRITSISLENVAGTAEFEVKNTSGSGDPLWEWVQEGAPTSGTTDYTLDAVKHLANGGYVSSTTASSIINGNSYLMMVPADYSASADARLKVEYDILYADEITSKGNTITKLLKDFTTEAGKNWIKGQAVSYNLTITLGGSVGNGHITFGATTVTDWGEPDDVVLPQADPANCHIIAPGASLTIPVNVRGNGGDVAGTGLSTGISPASVGVVWQSASNLIQNIAFNSTTATITTNSTPSTGGNAVIAAYSGADRTGTILWSWHIWVTTYDPNTPSNGTTYTLANSVTSNVFMDRNLGATSTAYSNDNNILHYQWGRKDPFPAASVKNVSNGDITVSISTTSQAQDLSVSILNPFTFIKSSSNWITPANTALWGESDINLTTPAAKTIFDPCPAGWRVPVWSSSKSPWEYLAYSSGSFTYSGLGYDGVFSSGAGWTFTYNSASVGFYPAAGFRYASPGSLDYMGSSGYYWSASPGSGIGYTLSFVSSSVSPSYIVGNRAFGFAVRCVQE